MKPFNRIAIIGVGLIGGSIGLAARNAHLAREVVGVFRRRSSLAKALARRAVDRGTLDLKAGLQGADLVIIATNVGAILPTLRRCAPYLKAGAVVTDVGSVKACIVRGAEKILPRWVAFVGAHPMAGSHAAGVEGARRDLFKGAVTILTKTASTNARALERLERFWHALGAKTARLTPDAHDKAVAMVSHLPQMAAVSLCLIQDAGTVRFAAGGLRDMTRIAASDPVMWVDIAKGNRLRILAALDAYIARLSRLRSDFNKGRFARIAADLRRAKTFRESL